MSAPLAPHHVAPLPWSAEVAPLPRRWRPVLDGSRVGWARGTDGAPALVHDSAIGILVYRDAGAAPAIVRAAVSCLVAGASGYDSVGG